MNRRPAVLTRQQGCFHVAGKPLISVNAGMSSSAALEQASCMLGAVECLAMNLGDDGIRGSEAFAIQYLTEMAKALIDSVASGAIHAEGGQ